MAATSTAAFEQPAHFEFDAESKAALDHVVSKYPPGKQASAVIPALYIAQNQMKRQTGSAWIPVKAMDAVGVDGDRFAGLRRCSAVHRHVSGEDQRLCALARGGEVSGEDQGVETALARCWRPHP